MHTVRVCTVAEVQKAPRIEQLLASYNAESSMPELGSAHADFVAYRKMEASGIYRAIGVFSPDLVGMAAVLVYSIPHYADRKIATMESFYVLPAFRKGGSGIKLLRMAEEESKRMGAKVLFVSAPIGKRLDKVMRKSGYRHSNNVYVKALS